MSEVAKRRHEAEGEPVRVLGRGLRAQRGVHLTLRAVREALGRTQIEVTETSQIDQGDISRLESRAAFDDCQVSTLERYMAALGGRLELVAAFGDKRITLTGVQDAPSRQSSTNRVLLRPGRKAPRR